MSTIKKQKVNKVKSIKTTTPARVEKKPFISNNRFGCLAVDDEYSDSSSIISDVQDNPSNGERINHALIFNTNKL